MPQSMKFPSGIPGFEVKEVERQVPDGEPPALPINEKLKVIGKPATRLDGRLKVTGAAKYTADINLPGMLYGMMLTATETAAIIKSIDTSAAEALPGVKAVHVLERVFGGANAADDAAGKYPQVRYAGQPIAAVAAISPSIARDALALIKVEYERKKWVVDEVKARDPDSPSVFAAPAVQAGTAGGGGGPQNVQQRGNVRGPSVNRNAATPEAIDKALAESDAVVEADYQTQVQTHSPLETHGVVVDWKDDLVTVYASTQGTLSVRDEIVDVFKLNRSKVRVVTEFMGGGFGAKFGAGNWGVLAAHLSQKAKAPVKLMCDRKEEHTCTGNRPSSQQRLRIGGKKDGSLTAIHVISYGTGGTGTGAGVAGPAQNLYPCPLIRTEEHDVFTHAGPAAAFRAPGHPQGVFAFEQAIDELAEKLGIDPLEFREKIDRHEARKVERKIGAEKAGWSKRKPPASDTGPIKRGMGVAQSLWFRGSRAQAECEVRISRDGAVEVLSAVQDIGTGIRTAMAQVVAEELGLKPANITMRIGDTNFPQGVNSGGSVTTNTMTPVTRKAAWNARKELVKVAAAALGIEEKDVVLADGKVYSASDASKSLPFRNACAKMDGEQITGRATRDRDYAGGPAMGGVQFCEVAVDTETGVIKVERVVAVHDCGRPINPLGVESQINGGIIQGISYALYEDRLLDRQTGLMVNANLEQYKIVGAKETPVIESYLIEDYQGRSATDAAGIGEPATVPTAAAVANAVYNAIGIRIRKIPMTPAVVLDAIAKAKAQTARAQGVQQ